MPDLREYFEESEEAWRIFIAAALLHHNIAHVAIVTEDSDGYTLKAQPSIKGKIRDIKTGEVKDVDLPILEDIPVKFAGGGNTVFTHPIKKGDEVMLIFAKQALDTWYESGGVQKAIDNRHNHLSDAMAIPGMWSKPRKIPNISTKSSQMRSVDGKHFVDMHPTDGLTLKSELQVTLHAPAHTIKGELTVQPTDDGKGGNIIVKMLNGQGGTVQADKSVGAPQLAGTLGPPETPPPSPPSPPPPPTA